MAFTVSEVIRVACLSCSWYVYAPTRQTSHMNDFVNGKSHARAEKVPLALAGYLWSVLWLKLNSTVKRATSAQSAKITWNPFTAVMSCNMKKGVSGSKLQDVLWFFLSFFWKGISVGWTHPIVDNETKVVERDKITVPTSHKLTFSKLAIIQKHIITLPRIPQTPVTFKNTMNRNK